MHNHSLPPVNRRRLGLRQGGALRSDTNPRSHLQQTLTGNEGEIITAWAVGQWGVFFLPPLAGKLGVGQEIPSKR
ncbi:hypothetical protein SBV1_1680002 [Verrucomicrobia bacterium]|nr:hypothetical protein SBV1_1680002 [Verrucomicrobiota bacterium]